MSNLSMSQYYQMVERAIVFINESQVTQPSLKAIADHLSMSEFHLQRLFSQWVGVSPKQYLQYLNKEKAKALLNESTVLNTSLAVGLSSTSRLHDLMIRCEGMTPGEYKSQGKNLKIDYGFCDSPFGPCLMALTARGVCKIAFCEEGKQVFTEREFIDSWCLSSLKRNDCLIQDYALTVFPRARPQAQSQFKSQQNFSLLMRGSEFQLKVWEALLAIPYGHLVAYQTLADAMGTPSAVRAVASAIGRNDIAFLIPCHRVIRKNGDISAYRWGAHRKQAMIAWEASVRQ